MKNKKIKIAIISLLFIFIVIILMVLKSPVNNYISNVFEPIEADSINRTELIFQNNIIINKENVVVQPMKFDKRINRVGIYVDNINANIDDMFEITLYDEYNNVFGKDIFRADEIKEKDYLYIKVEFITKNKNTYKLEIKTYNSGAGEMYLSAAKPDERTTPLLINATETNTSLITSIKPTRTRNAVKIIIGILFVIYIVIIIKILYGFRKREMNE